ncbi:MAG: type I glyceraldehyde-3-phosphate dehydrogenase [Candidatus Yanofskybacteria bacterium RIFCSPLOWO2_01_FULL_42_49]|uniref:Type I glyceraldehyde-3-phosphate dehydrogenase n=1 Tax=Candidatus Yanofskybacteria bacterium RIFCSPLOWO2_01_FULL_42_49 TaxID=1802694 RepID=A0A1F8GDT2_9BACT|nr:MAG: type I glyceraldehyde-3-phosphate dehydrogenase [Candidatus Yanofskybacteria bacterium RIFCSPLOWO2_01_FULL_42_49]
MSKRVAINGFGRIGRAFFKLALTKPAFAEASAGKPELEIVAINDLGDIENLAYLLKYDSAYGRFNKEVSVRDGKLIVDSNEYLFIQEKDLAKLPWKELGVDIVVESTGAFETFDKISAHKTAGAKRVVLTAPAKDADTADTKTVLMGVNDDDLKTCTISSNGSCTTNSASPILQILSETIGVKKAFLNTTHGYTATQNLVDGPVRGHDFRRGRAGGVNIVPSYTGAAVAVGRAVKAVENKFEGTSMRVPIITGSLSSITFVSEKPTTIEEINKILRDAADQPRWQGIFRVTDDQIVSSDIIGDPYAAIADLLLTKVVDGDLCSVYSWYDNEFGYTNTLVQHVLKVAELM